MEVATSTVAGEKQTGFTSGALGPLLPSHATSTRPRADERLATSPLLRYVPHSRGDRVFVYHTLFGNPRVLNLEGVLLLRLLTPGKTIRELRAEVSGDPTALLTEFIRINFVVASNTNERAIVQARREELLARICGGLSIDHISLSVSDNCNFGCHYCMLYQPDTQGRPLPIYQKPARALMMTWPTAKKCIDTYLGLLVERGERHARIHFGNAEPLINWPVIQQVLDYCGRLDGFTFEFAINTNLSLLSRQMAEALKTYRVRIATSLDGVGEANDLIRVTKSGRGTFNRILAKIDLLESIGYPLDGVSITVTARNFERVGEEIIDFAVERKMTSLAFDYDLVGFLTVPIKDRVDKVIRLKKYANSRGIYFGGTWYSPFKKIITTSMLDRPHAFCAAVEGRALVFNPNGSLKTCGYTTTAVGHVDNLGEVLAEGSGLPQLAAERFPGTDPYCRGCMIEGACGGQCHSTWEVARRGKMEVFDDMCQYYRSITDVLIQDYLDALDDPHELEVRTRFL